MQLDKMEKYITESLFILLKKYPYSKISMEMIAEKAGVSRRSIYRYFPNKQSILDLFFVDFASPLFMQLENKFSNNQDVILISFNYLFEKKDILEVFYKNGLMTELYYFIESVATQVIKITSIQSFVTIEDELTDYYITITTGSIYHLLCKWFEKGATKNPTELFEVYRRLIRILAKKLS